MTFLVDSKMALAWLACILTHMLWFHICYNFFIEVVYCLDFFEVPIYLSEHLHLCLDEVHTASVFFDFEHQTQTDILL